MARVHAFADDVLAEHDAVALADLVRRGEVSPVELAEAARARAGEVDPTLNAVVFEADQPRYSEGDGPFAGVPTYVKDNTDVRGMPTGHGTRAFTPRPAESDGAFAEVFTGAGFTVLGKSRLPEFGFNASTEFDGADPTRNPWNPEYSSGASSGGSAALVAAGVVPIAHANDGGGSIRIPAACCGLVGLKPSRGRLVSNEMGRSMPINIVADGVVSRSVRDTAAFLAAAERHWRNTEMPSIGLVEGPSNRRLRVGVILDHVNGSPVDAATKDAVESTAVALEKMGHQVSPATLPVGAGFVRDFITYWGMLAFLISTFGKQQLGRDFDAKKLDGFSKGLRERYLRSALTTPARLYRLFRIKTSYAEMFAEHDVIVSPVLAHTTPKLGYLAPTVPFDELLERLTNYVAFTPLNNVAGTPGLSLPLGTTAEGMPIGVHFSTAFGDERTLLDIAFALEQEQPWRRIQM
jgi:amidase